jgi:hypothetical protein
MKEVENKLQRFWRPIVAYTYIIICIFDFILMPMWYEISNTTVNIRDSVDLSLKYAPEYQEKVLVGLTTKRVWQPLTLDTAGTFHLAFGAILGAAAYTRGREKQERVRYSGRSTYGQNNRPDNPDEDC